MRVARRVSGVCSGAGTALLAFEVCARPSKIQRAPTQLQENRRRMMKEKGSVLKKATNRRSFFKNGMVAAGAATMGAGLLSGGVAAFGHDDDDSASITKGDIAILRFLNALEQVEADLWLQYSELGGTQDNEVSGVNGGNALYTAALQILDGDIAQYIHDKTDDEINHHRFLNKYLASKGAKKVDLSHFATLPSSKADGARQIGRLT